MVRSPRSVLQSLRASAEDARRYARANRAGLAAVATLFLIVLAVMRRRFKLGMVLFHVAVALGEKWQEGRARRRVGELLMARAPEALPASPAGAPDTSPAPPPDLA